MQIRHTRGRTQFLRTYYDNVAKRSRQKLIGSMERGAKELPPELASLMTEAEIEEFAVWLEREAESERAAQARQEIETLPQTMKNVAGHILRGAKLTNEQAKGMWNGMALLRRHLTKAGYTKPNLNDSQESSQED